MKVILKTGLIVSILMFLSGFALNLLFNAVVPGLQAEYMNENLFRSWSDPLMMLFFLYPFVVGFTLAWLWEKIKSSFTGTKPEQIKKFALGYWLVVGMPGMLVTYSNFQVSFLMVLSWSINSLIYGLIAGVIFVCLSPKK